MRVKVTIDRDALKNSVAPADTEILEQETDQADMEHFFDDAVVFFSLMLDSIQA